MSRIVTVKFTPVLDTAAYTAGDILFPATLIPGGPRNGIIRGISILDKDDVGESVDLVFLDSSVAWGAANAVPSVADVDTEAIIGIVTTVIASIDVGNSRIGHFPVELAFDSNAGLYVVGITRTALTHTASGVVFNFRMEQP